MQDREAFQKTYQRDEKIPFGCGDCEGCSECCREMGDSIVQDPFDLWLFCSNMRVAGGAQATFDMLISEDGPWELTYQDGAILPAIKMVEDGRCPFLNARGRCSIHPVRSGLCRLYPLGRQYLLEQNLRYFLLEGSLGCGKMQPSEAGISPREWLGIARLEEYEAFQITWHRIRTELPVLAKENSLQLESLQRSLLVTFYAKPYEGDFFAEFAARAAWWDREKKTV